MREKKKKDGMREKKKKDGMREKKKKDGMREKKKKDGMREKKKKDGMREKKSLFQEPTQRTEMKQLLLFSWRLDFTLSHRDAAGPSSHQPITAHFHSPVLRLLLRRREMEPGRTRRPKSSTVIIFQKDKIFMLELVVLVVVCLLDEAALLASDI
ncbi:Hypothetical protein SMAX5B_012240 [Scophthalmus maximus]|uniref:Uncharacterized protein n=1 Tax=Scophthalmus maximus TaxID=52904 RepID=A0A2U9B6W3_SCOMX|nr:Hypothetical protein SMAX5B_012240 [Scophthalmus maximus]KAF0022769.1 hypothetical protein F2P81_024750 [Scophthalmus maximus]